MEKLTECEDRFEAEVLVSKLNAFGIEAIIDSDDVGGLNPFLSRSNGVFVLVPTSQIDEARKIQMDIK